MKVSTIINSAIQSLELKKYLELGVSNGAIFLEIKAPVRVGVDPAENSCATVKEDLESYLTHSKESFDVIYLNFFQSQNEFRQNFEKAMSLLSEKGVLFLKGINPVAEIMQLEKKDQFLWTGDSWKYWVELRRDCSQLEMFSVNMHHGLGVIRRGKQELIQSKIDFTFEQFYKNKKRWLNLKEANDSHVHVKNWSRKKSFEGRKISPSIASAS